MATFDPNEIEEKLLRIFTALSEVMNATGEDVDTVIRRLDAFSGGAIGDLLKELDHLQDGLKKKFVGSLKEGGKAIEGVTKEVVTLSKNNVAAEASLGKLNERSRVLAQESKKLIKSYSDTHEVIHKQVKAKELEARNYKEAVQATEKYARAQEDLQKVQDDEIIILANQRKAKSDYNRLKEELNNKDIKLSKEERAKKEADLEKAKKDSKENARLLKQLESDKRDHERQLGIIEEEGFEERRDAYIEASQHSSKFSDIFKGAVIGSLMSSERPLKNFTSMMDNAYSEKKRKSISQMGKAFTDLFAKGEGGKRSLSTNLKNFGKGMASSVGSATKAMGAKAMGVGGMVAQKLIDTLGKIAETIGKLTGITTLFKPLETIANAISEMMESMVENAFKFQRSLGASSVEASKVATELTATADFMRLGPDAIKVMNESFQSLVEYSNSYRHNIKGTVGLVAKIAEGTQISTSESAQFTTQMKDGLKMSNDEIENMVSSLRTDAQGAGVSFKLVMQDVAKNGARMSMYGEQIAMGITKAAVRARELGGQLSTWTGLMDSFGDGWEGVTNFVTDFNRLAGPGLLDIWDLQQKRMSGDVEGFQDTIVNAMKNVDKQTREGYLGQRFAKMLGMDADEYAKLLQKLDIEDMFEKQIGNAEKMLGGKDGLFGMLAGNDESFTKAFSAWEKGMIGANKNVDEELRKMQTRALQTAIDEAVNSGVVKNAEEFIQRLKKGDKSDAVVKGFQKAMRQGLDFQSMDDMNDALEKSLSPQQGMEAMIKQLVKEIMPSILELMGWLVKGISQLIELFNYSFLGPESDTLSDFSSNMSKIGSQFAYMGEEFKKQNIDTDFQGQLSSQLQQAFDHYMGEGAVNVQELYQSGQTDVLSKKLEELNGKDIGENVGRVVSEAINKINERKVTEKNSDKNKDEMSIDYKSVRERERLAEKNLSTTEKIGKKVNDFLNIFGAGADVKLKKTTKVNDVAFGAGEARYIIDSGGKTYELNQKDALVASTNFDFGKDNITSGTPLPEGKLSIRTPLTTDGKGGAGKFISKKDAEALDVLNKMIGLKLPNVSDPTNEVLKAWVPEGGEKIGSMSGIKPLPSGFGLSKDRGGFMVSDAVDQLIKLNEEWMSMGNQHMNLISAFRASEPEDKKKLGLTNQSQRELYQLHVAGKGNPANRPGKSMHEAGLAFDVTGKPKSDEEFRELVKKFGYSGIAGGSEKHHFGFRTSAGYNPASSKDAVEAFKSKFLSGEASPLISQLDNTVGDIAFNSGTVKRIIDKWGNLYDLKSGESVLTTPNISKDNVLAGKMRSFLGKGSIYQKIPVPTSWHKKSKEIFDQDVFGDYIHDKDFASVMSSRGVENASKFATWALKKIGYSDDKISSLQEADRIQKIYNELFYGYNSDIKKSDREKDMTEVFRNFLKHDEKGSGSLSEVENEIMNLIGKHEGSYGSLNANDAGKPSYGRIQFRGSKFKSILNEYLKTDGSYVNQLMAYKDQIDKWDNEGLTLSSNKDFKNLVKLIGDDPVMRSIQDSRAEEGYLSPTKKIFDSIGLKSMGSFYAMADTKVNGGLEDVLNNRGARTYPTSDELSWVNNFLDKRLERYKSLGTWDTYGRGWEGRINKMRKEMPDLVERNISDAYFGQGAVQSILGVDGKLYKPSERDNVAVGTQLPNVSTKTSLAEGKLMDYLSTKTTGTDGGSSQRQDTELKRAYDKAQRDNDMLMDKMDRLIRAVRETGGAGGGGDVVIDGAKIGRFIDTNKNTSRRKGLTLNG